jgi:hypothetical protein
MDTHQLRNVLTRDLGPSFGGVYTRDLLPQTLDGKAIVINTDPHDQPGAHWVCVYLNSPVVEYFDSYGLPPMHRDIKDFIARHGKPIHNPHVYQDLKMCVGNTACIIYTNDIEAEKPFKRIHSHENQENEAPDEEISSSSSSMETLCEHS